MKGNYINELDMCDQLSPGQVGWFIMALFSIQAIWKYIAKLMKDTDDSNHNLVILIACNGQDTWSNRKEK